MLIIYIPNLYAYYLVHSSVNCLKSEIMGVELFWYRTLVKSVVAYCI